MEKKEAFQKRFQEFVVWVQTASEMVSREQVEQFFEGTQLKEQQLNMIMDYVADQQKKLPEMTPEDRAYLTEYQEILKALPERDADQQQILEQYLAGREEYRETIISMFLPLAAQTAKRMQKAGIALEDMIQEANLALTMGIEQITSVQSAEDEIRAFVQNQLAKFLQEQADLESKDKIIIARVELLNESLDKLRKELGRKVMVEELAIDMDLSEDEVLDILKLTGEVPGDYE